MTEEPTIAVIILDEEGDLRPIMNLPESIYLKYRYSPANDLKLLKEIIQRGEDNE